LLWNKGAHKILSAVNSWSNLKRCMVAFAVAIAVLTLASAATPPKRVLLVYDTEVYSPASFEVQQGLLKRLRTQLGQNMEFFCEQLEANRFPDMQDHALSWVRTRYATQHIDVVIFVGEASKAILPGVPTVYAGFTSPGVFGEQANLAHDATVRFDLNFKKTVLAALRLQPKAANVLVIAGSGYGDHALLDEVRNQIKDLHLTVEYLADASIDDLLARVAQLPRDTIVFPVSYTRDATGNLYHTPDVVASLSRVSAAPIYVAADTSIGSGAVGGYVVSFQRIGAAIADVAVQAVAGNAPAHVSVPPEATAAYTFDWRELERWRLSEGDLPPGSVVEYKVPTAWEQYRRRIIAIIVVLVVQTILIIGLLINRRHRKHAEASLRDMTGRLLESQDEERRRIARDLHDGTGQHLSGMALSIGQVLADFPPGHDRLRQLLQDSHVASRQALDEVRTVSYVLHPPILDGLGLVAALRWYLEGLQKRTDLTVDFQAPSEIRNLAPEAERALFRIVQESVTNVLRHSGATSLRVALSGDDKHVALVILDNGQGMSTEHLAGLEGAANLGVGIAGMRERVRQLGGSFRIESGASGTKVSVSVPANEERYVAHLAGR
jgi:signal transduction histidine kinase